MSDKAIRVGDLVMVVRSCCSGCLEDGQMLGIPWRVRKIIMEKVRCKFCGATGTEAIALAESEFGNRCTRAPLPWLKRLDPPADAVSEDARKTIEEPA